MPALVQTAHRGRVEWLGVVADRAKSLTSDAKTRLNVTLEGADGEAHGGATRPACSRVSALYRKGLMIRNTRQMSILSLEELDAIADGMGVEAIDPGWLGTSLVLSGIPDLSFLPPSSRLQVNKGKGPTLVVDLENRPCKYPAEVIQSVVGPAGRKFMSAAKGRRGLVAWVEDAGEINLGDEVRLFVPEQRRWRGDHP